MNQSPSPETPKITPFPEPTALPPPLGGRPSIFSAELAAEICAAIRLDGLSDSSAGLLHSVSKSTLSRWKQENEDFAVALGQARAQFEQARLREIRQTRKRDGSPDWRAIAWVLQKTSPESFGTPSRRRARKEPEAEPEENHGQPVVSPEEQVRLQAARARTLERVRPGRPPGEPPPSGSAVIPGVAPMEADTIRPETSVHAACAAMAAPVDNVTNRPETPCDLAAARLAEEQAEADRRLLDYIMNDLPDIFPPAEEDWRRDAIPGMWTGA